MKKNKEPVIYLVLALLVVWCPMFMGAWDKDKPSSSTSLRASNPEILANWSALETALSQDHTFAAGSPDGKHTQITFTDPISTPGDVANEGVIYIKDVGGVVEFHFKDESGNELQLTSGGKLFSSRDFAVTTKFTVASATGNTAVSGTLGVTGDFAVNTNKFTVAASSGNTVIAGTASVTGTLGVTGIATLGDSSQMATSAAPTTDADLANKKYVDDQITANAAASAALAKAWCNVAANGTLGSGDYNITSSSVGANGVYTITWDTDFADTNYVVIVNGFDDGLGVGTRHYFSVDSKATGSCVINTTDHDGSGTNTDFSLVAFGTQ